MNLLRFWLILLCTVGLFQKASTQGRRHANDNYLQEFNRVNKPMGKDYYSSLFLGNGLLGAMIWQKSNSTLQVQIGRSDVTDTRIDPAEDTVNGMALYNRARLPIGYFTLHTAGKILSAEQTLDIYKAVIQAKVITDAGTIQLSARVLTGEQVIVADWETSGKETTAVWKWNPDTAISPRYRFGPAYNNSAPESYKAHPNSLWKTGQSGAYYYCYQPLLKGGYATAWMQQSTGNDKKRIWISIGYNKTSKAGLSKQEAIASIKNAAQKSWNSLLGTHEAWWKNYYAKSFVSVPDKTLEGFYWMQLYKLASATRENSALIDLMGPWMYPSTPWPSIWWNLNTQLTYSPVFTANHAELAKPLLDLLWQNREQLHKNVPLAFRSNGALAINRSSSFDLISPMRLSQAPSNLFEAGNLVWLLQLCYQYADYTGDDAAMGQRVFPLLKGSVQFLINLLQKGEDGFYHLPVTASPEYKPAEDANYTLAGLQWGLKTLQEIDSSFHINDPSRKVWKEVSANLASFPKNETGFLIGKDVALTAGHRHYSHLLMIFPYHLVHWEQPDNRDLIERSLRHWLSYKSGLQGYTFTGSSAMYSSMGRGDTAYALVNTFLKRFLQPNTLYKETGPVFETPLSAVTSFQYFLLQSWNKVLRVFPAVPSSWQEAEFTNWRAEGAFRVSAVRQSGKTASIIVHSEKGNYCVVQTDIPVTQLQVVSSFDKEKKYQVSEIDGWTRIAFPTRKGEEVEIKNAMNN